MSATAPRSAHPRRGPAWLGPLGEYAPLATFLVAYWLADLMVATVALIGATAVGLCVTWYAQRRIPPMPLVTAGIVAVFGGLTIALADETFIKMKPTIVQALFAAVLLGGLAFGKSLLKPVLGHAWSLTDAGWRLLSLRFGLFFCAMAVLNEVVWRTVSTDLWVNFKVFGIVLITIAFTMAQVPLINRNTTPDAAADDDPGQGNGDRQS